MKHSFRWPVVALVLLALTALSADGAIERRARRYNMLELHGGAAQPAGKYSGIGPLEFRDSNGRLYELDADQVYDPSWHIGLNYGSFRGGHWIISGGLHYTRVKDVNYYPSGDLIRFILPRPSISQWDLNLELDYLLADVSRAVLTPFLGLNLQTGFNVMTADSVQSESRATVAVAVVAGLEMRLVSLDRGFVTLASRNSYDFAASGDRPRFFSIGAGLKYYFQM